VGRHYSSPYANGVMSSSPGLPRSGYPGNGIHKTFYANGVVSPSWGRQFSAIQEGSCRVVESAASPTNSVAVRF